MTRLETPPETETTSSIGLEVGADEAVAAEAPVVDTAVKEEADTEVIATENATTVTEAIGALIEDAGVIAVTVPAAETGEEPDATDLPDQAETVNIAVDLAETEARQPEAAEGLTLDPTVTTTATNEATRRQTWKMKQEEIKNRASQIRKKEIKLMIVRSTSSSGCKEATPASPDP